MLFHHFTDCSPYDLRRLNCSCMLLHELVGCSSCDPLRGVWTTGCKRKFDVKGYIKLIGDMVAKIKAEAKAKA